MEIFREQARMNSKCFSCHIARRKCPCSPGCWGPRADVRNYERCSADSDYYMHMCSIQGQITQSEHLPLALPPTRARVHTLRKRLERAPASLPLFVPAAWWVALRIMAVCSPIPIAGRWIPFQIFIPLCLKNVAFGALVRIICRNKIQDPH